MPENHDQSSEGDDRAVDWLPLIDQPFRDWLGVGVALVILVLLTRIFIFPAVFRRGEVVLLANDPYRYRFVVDGIVLAAEGPLDPTVLTNGTTTPLYVAVLSWLSMLFGGGLTTVGMVLAWYPPIVALLTVGVVYLISVRVTNQRWVGVIAAIALAITPIHAVRSALGYADHHAFDYLLLGLTALAIVWLATAEFDARWQSRKGWALAGLLGAGVSSQVLAWDGGVILLVPIGIYVALSSISAVRADRSPLGDNRFLVIGLAIGAILAVIPYFVLDWHSKLPEVVFMPTILFAGVIGVLVVAEGIFRLYRSATLLALVQLVGLGMLLAIIPRISQTQAVLDQGINHFTRTTGGVIAEGVPMVVSATDIISGPLWLFGALLFLAIPAVIGAGVVAYRSHRPEWIALVVYLVFFLALALVQRRFAGELSVFVAVFAAITFIYLAQYQNIVEGFSPFDEAERSLSLVPETDTRSLVIFFILMVTIVAASAYMLPIMMNSATIDGDDHDAALAIHDYSEEHELEYSETKVMSTWDRNRMYNYFVSHRAVPALRYSYSKANYVDFLASTDPEQQYGEHGGSIGFVVTKQGEMPLIDVLLASGEQTSTTMYTRLQRHFGSSYEDVPGVANYKAVYANEDGSLKVFRLVPGATLQGMAEPNTTVEVSTDVSLDHGTFTYSTYTTADAEGRYNVTVPNPGEYTVVSDAGLDTDVSVTLSAIEEGATVEVADS